MALRRVDVGALSECGGGWCLYLGLVAGYWLERFPPSVFVKLMSVWTGLEHFTRDATLFLRLVSSTGLYRGLSRERFWLRGS